jgi:hypothetical protein
MDLPLYDHRVDDVPAVVHSHKTAYLRFPCSFVDVHHANVSAKRERKVGRIIVVDRF